VQQQKYHPNVTVLGSKGQAVAKSGPGWKRWLLSCCMCLLLAVQLMLWSLLLCVLLLRRGLLPLLLRTSDSPGSGEQQAYDLHMPIGCSSPQCLAPLKVQCHTPVKQQLNHLWVASCCRCHQAAIMLKVAPWAVRAIKRICSKVEEELNHW
jgi:hypothetical protein